MTMNTGQIHEITTLLTHTNRVILNPTKGSLLSCNIYQRLGKVDERPTRTSQTQLKYYAIILLLYLVDSIKVAILT